MDHFIQTSKGDASPFFLAQQHPCL